MYGREEAKRLKEEFWTAFGQYMVHVPSADMEKVNWVNYKTGIKHLFFRMDVSNKTANIRIEIAHPDEGIRQLMYAQFVEMKTVLTDTLGEEWIWDDVYYDEYGKPNARISLSLANVSVFRQSDWPALISFFKPRIIALDEFWSMAKYAFDIFK